MPRNRGTVSHCSGYAVMIFFSLSFPSILLSRSPGCRSMRVLQNPPSSTAPLDLYDNLPVGMLGQICEALKSIINYDLPCFGGLQKWS